MKLRDVPEEEFRAAIEAMPYEDLAILHETLKAAFRRDLQNTHET